MTDIVQAIQTGSASLWIFIPTAILLGALHGLEPGHSKTMMAAFIIAIRGTIAQAVLLGLSAAVSHSLLIWLLAALALHYGSQWNVESVEPWLQIVSAVIIGLMALWMLRRTRREAREAAEHGHGHGHGHHGHSHGHGHEHEHEHGGVGSGFEFRRNSAPDGHHGRGESGEHEQEHEDGRGRHGGMMLDTGHGWLEIAVFEEGVAPRFRVHPCKASGEATPLPRGTTVSIETARLDGRTQRFQFEPQAGGYWEATAVLPEPHDFMATVTMAHGDHAHTYRVRFREEHGHDHDHGHHGQEEREDQEQEQEVYQDAHERAHAEDIARRFGSRSVTTPQIVLFGITGGLMPCPAAFTILLVCLQLKRVALGFTIVGAFSFGLALTMVTVGALAAMSVQHAQKRFRGLGDAMRKAPYVSCALLVLLALYMAYSGWHGLAHEHVH
jgi:nickel/cobalt exporter